MVNLRATAGTAGARLAPAEVERDSPRASGTTGNRGRPPPRRAATRWSGALAQGRGPADGRRDESGGGSGGPSRHPTVVRRQAATGIAVCWVQAVVSS